MCGKKNGAFAMPGQHGQGQQVGVAPRSRSCLPGVRGGGLLVIGGSAGAGQRGGDGCLSLKLGQDGRGRYIQHGLLHPQRFGSLYVGVIVDRGWGGAG